MTLPRCCAVVLHGRDAKGNRAGLIAPRRCQRVATADSYCGLHARQAEMQDLLRQCLSPGWEATVKRFEERGRREAAAEGRRVAAGLASAALDHRMYGLAAFLGGRSREVGEAWASGQA